MKILNGKLLHVSEFDIKDGDGIVRVPSRVNMIADHAFTELTELQEVILPETLTTIGNWVFSGCSNLVKVNFPKALTDIGDGAFNNCTSLKEAKLPEGLTFLGKWAFFGCASMETMEFPKALPAINGWACCGCKSLRRVRFPDSLFIGESAFEECDEITLPAGAVIMDEDAKEEEPRILHVYAQGGPHDDARIIGTKEALENLRDAIDSTLDSGREERCAGLFTADGEGFDLLVEMQHGKRLEKAPTPYTDENFRNANQEGVDAVGPGT